MKLVCMALYTQRDFHGHKNIRTIDKRRISVRLLKCLPPFRQFRFESNEVSPIVGKRQDINSTSLIIELARYFNASPRTIVGAKLPHESAHQVCFCFKQAPSSAGRILNRAKVTTGVFALDRTYGRIGVSYTTRLWRETYLQNGKASAKP
jgi:hypothetical protein